MLVNVEATSNGHGNSFRLRRHDASYHFIAGVSRIDEVEEFSGSVDGHQ